MNKILYILLVTFFLPILCPNQLQADSNNQHESKRNWSEYRNSIVKSTRSIRGWCTPEKQTALMNLIFKKKPKICVEIGVYGGKSLIPMAAALKYNKQGRIYGIDPWKLDECVKNYSSDSQIPKIWEKQDLEKIYLDCLSDIQKYEVNDYCSILRMTSVEAEPQFNSIDILHIDGNHSEASTIVDVQLYFDKVKEGGYIWLDDASRDSTKKAYQIVAQSSKIIKSVDNGNCLLFRKNRGKK